MTSSSARTATVDHHRAKSKRLAVAASPPD